MYTLKNKVQLIGNLGNAPEVKNTHNLVAWGKVADIVEKYLNKGSEVAVEGKLISRSYTDKEGVKKFISEVEINELLMLGSKTTA